MSDGPGCKITFLDYIQRNKDLILISYVSILFDNNFLLSSVQINWFLNKNLEMAFWASFKNMVVEGILPIFFCSSSFTVHCTTVLQNNAFSASNGRILQLKIYAPYPIIDNKANTPPNSQKYLSGI